MTDKKPIGLVVTDIDNTIADKFGAWGNALDAAMDKLAKLYGRDRADLEKDMLDNVPESMKHISGPYIGKDLRMDIALTPSMNPASPEQEKGLEKILHEWDKDKSKAELYSGVRETINKIKSSGAKLVLYTDSRESVCVPRLAKMGITADMIDGLYVLPDLKDGQVIHKPVKGAAEEFRKALGDKLVTLPPKSNKPNPKNMQRILDDMGVKDPKTAVMVGDNIRSDGTGAIACGMNYAWQMGGTKIDDATMRCYKVFCQDPNYKLTTEEHLTQLNDTNRPTERLSSFKDVTKFYQFTTPEKALTAVQAKAQAKQPNVALMKKMREGR